MSRPKPSFWLFLKNKIYEPNLILLPWVLFMFIYAMLLFSSKQSPYRPYAPLVTFSTTILCAIGIVIRLMFARKNFQEVNSTFANGAETDGEVIDVHFSRGNGYVTYEYQYQQKQYRSTDSVNQNRKTRDITVGQKVTLYINQEKPTQAFIRNLYLNTF